MGTVFEVNCITNNKMGSLMDYGVWFMVVSCPPPTTVLIFFKSNNKKKLKTSFSGEMYMLNRDVT